MLWLQHLSPTVSLGSEERRASDGYKLISNQQIRWGSVCWFLAKKCSSLVWSPPGLDFWTGYVQCICFAPAWAASDLILTLVWLLLIEWNFLRKKKKSVTLHKYNVKRSTEGCSWIRYIRFLWGGGLVFWEYRLERGLEDWRSKDRLSACFDVKYRWRIITSASVQTDVGAAVCHSDMIRCGHGSCSIGLLMQLQSNTNTLSISVMCEFSELTQPWAESRRNVLASHLGRSPPMILSHWQSEISWDKDQLWKNEAAGFRGSG